MKTLNKRKLDDAVANAKKYIHQMQHMDDKQLAKHIDLYRQQMQMAYKLGNIEACELLNEYEKQTIAARLKKNFE